MKRPFVLINMAMTADGKITSASREYPRFTSGYDRVGMDRLRAGVDAILVGAGTMRADNPALHVRDREMREYRASLGKPAGLSRVLVTRSGSIAPDSRFFSDEGCGELIVATVEETPPEVFSAVQDRVQVWRCGRGDVDVGLLLQRLHEHGVERLLVEGGGELNWHFIEADVLDELYVTIAPTLLGGRDAPTLLEGEGLSMKAQRRLRLAGLHREGDELYCRYEVVR